MVKVKSDGNGGYDVNVQKAILTKWGPVGLVLFMLLSGLGAKMGEEAWVWMSGHKAVELQVGLNKELAQEAHDGMMEFRAEVSDDLREIRSGQVRLENIVIGYIAQYNEQEEGK